MLNPIEVAYQSGATLYCVIHKKDGTVWNGSAFEAYNPAHWATYAVALTEQAGSGYYSAAAPVGIGSNLVTECIYVQVGGSPALSDAAPGPSGIGQAQGTDIASVVHAESAAGNMQANLGALVLGVAAAGTLSTTQMTTNLVATLANVYVGRLVIFLTGSQSGVAATITSYNLSGGLLSFTAIGGAPSANDTFIIV
jgi:hypothetical protein